MGLLEVDILKIFDFSENFKFFIFIYLFIYFFFFYYGFQNFLVSGLKFPGFSGFVNFYLFIVFELFLCCCPVSSCNLSQVARSHLGPGERPRPKVQQGPEGPGGQVEEVRHRPGPEEEAALRQGGRGDCHHRGYGRRGESPFTLSSPGSSPGTWHHVFHLAPGTRFVLPWTWSVPVSLVSTGRPRGGMSTTFLHLPGSKS